MSDKNNYRAKVLLKSVMKIYGIIFIAIIVSIVIASLYVSNSGSILQEKSPAAYFMQWIAIAATIGILPAGYISSQRSIKKIKTSISLSAKLLPYRKAMIFKFLSILSAAVLSSAFFLLTGNTNLMLILAIIILFYIISKPNPFKIADDLNLNEEEKQELMTK